MGSPQPVNDPTQLSSAVLIQNLPSPPLTNIISMACTTTERHGSNYSSRHGNIHYRQGEGKSEQPKKIIRKSHVMRRKTFVNVLYQKTRGLLKRISLFITGKTQPVRICIVFCGSREALKSSIKITLMMKLKWSQLGLGDFKFSKEISATSWGVEFERHGHLADREV